MFLNQNNYLTDSNQTKAKLVLLFFSVFINNNVENHLYT